MPTYTIYVCPECDSYTDSSGWCANGHESTAFERVECVRASVLEERDRELEVERRRSNGVASHAGCWAKRARESALEAEQLRSQLTEARALLTEIRRKLWLGPPNDLQCQDWINRIRELVPAPQDREPAT